MRLAFALVVLAAIAPLSAGSALADHDRCRGPVSAQDAVWIARSAGLIHVAGVECDDGRWEVEGRDARGRDMEVEIDRRTGHILDIERDD